MAEHKAPILWSPEALDDIDHLWDYYAQTAGRGTADKILREIAKTVAIIDEFPFAGRTLFPEHGPFNAFGAVSAVLAFVALQRFKLGIVPVVLGAAALGVLWKLVLA